MSSGDTLERGEIGWPWNELHRLEAELNTLRAELESEKRQHKDTIYAFSEKLQAAEARAQALSQVEPQERVCPECGIPDHSEARCERVLFMANERCRLSAGHQGDHEAGPYREAQDADSKRRFSSDSTGDRVPPAGEGADRGGGGASPPSASQVAPAPPTSTPEKGERGE